MAFRRLESIVSAIDVARKWQVDSQTLGEITRIDRIYVYCLRDTRQLPDGKKIYLCDGPYMQGMPYEEYFCQRIYDLSSYVFNLEEIEEYETAHPEYLLPQAAEDEREYIPAEELRKELGLSPIRFVEFLRKHHAGLPLFGLCRNDMDFFYDNFTRLVEAATLLNNITIHSLDWEGFQKQGKTDTQFGDIPFPTVAVDIADFESQLAEAQKQLEGIESARRRNEQFTTERAELEKSLVEKDVRITALEKELAVAKAELENGKGLAGAVCRMRREGKSDEEIAAHFSDGGKWCSDSQVRALLHPDEN